MHHDHTLRPDWVLQWLLTAFFIIAIAVTGYFCDHHKRQQAPEREPVVQSRRIAVETTPQPDLAGHYK